MHIVRYSSHLNIGRLFVDNVRTLTTTSRLKQHFIMSNTTANLAAWQMEAKGPLSVKETPLHEPGPGEVRIKVCSFCPLFSHSLTKNDRF